ncbi:MAG: gph 1 [Burkholderiaceae bacterium]|nr:gph 1 [Burkholderiaceae bacterium]
MFDLDGTLIDSAPDLAGALNALRIKRWLPPLPLARLRPFASNSACELLGAGAGIDDTHPDYLVMRDELLECYEQHTTEHICLFDGVDAVLAHLENNHIAWGIVTNKYQRFTTPVVRALGLDQRAQIIVCGDTAAHAKPHPEPLIYTAKYLDIPPCNLILCRR